LVKLSIFSCLKWGSSALRANSSLRVTVNLPRRAHSDTSGERSLLGRSAPTGGAPVVSAWKGRGAHISPRSLQKTMSFVVVSSLSAYLRARAARPLNTTEHGGLLHVFSERPGRASARRYALVEDAATNDLVF